MMPLSSPRNACCSRKPARVRFAIQRLQHDHQRHRHERDSGEAHVEQQHGHCHAHEAQHARNQARHPRLEHVADVLDIVRQPAHQLAVGPLVEEAQRQRLQLGEEVIAQGHDGALRCPDIT